MVTNRLGSQTMIFQGYTFNRSKHGGRSYVCTSRRSRVNCNKARVFLNPNGTIKRFVSDHTHAPPKFIINNGRYVKV